MLAHRQIVVRAPYGDRLRPIAAEALRIGIIPLGAQDVDEDAIAAFFVKAFDRRLEDAVVIHGSLSGRIAPHVAEGHCERLAIRPPRPSTNLRPRLSIFRS